MWAYDGAPAAVVAAAAAAGDVVVAVWPGVLVARRIEQPPAVFRGSCSADRGLGVWCSFVIPITHTHTHRYISTKSLFILFNSTLNYEIQISNHY